ncbi:MAG: protocatechuate 3,4-dioxygenase subunit alpha [Pseudomonadota bacterium]
MAVSDDKEKETPSQTAGPYVHIGLASSAAGFEIYDKTFGQDIAGPHAEGERIRVHGQVTDGDGAALTDVMIELWQANAQGRYAHPAGGGPVEPGFRGWGRAMSDFDTGEWVFDTVKPGAVDGQAPHISFWLVARGINIGLHTRMYFSDDAALHVQDPIMASIEPASRRATLIATRSDENTVPIYRFDIRLQGHGETVFFDV